MIENKTDLESTGEPDHPFGLPLGTIRGVFSLLICGFFWLIILLPVREDMPPVKAVLGHFFMLALVFMAFASNPAGGLTKKHLLPWLLRVLFVIGTVGVVGYGWFRDKVVFQSRLTPDVQEFSEWWLPYLAVMATGFGFGLLLRLVLGQSSHIFRTLRSWLSVVGMILLLIEYALFIGYASADSKPVEFFRVWQAIELGFVSAYFGTRT
jgi:hypothetical protein